MLFSIVLFMPVCSTTFAAGPVDAFDARVAGGGNSTSGGDNVDLSDFYKKLKGVALALLLVMTVCGGVLAATGKTQLAFATIAGAVILFGAPWLIITIAKALNRI